MNVDTKTIVAGVAVVVAAGAGFLGGMQYQKTQTVANFRNGFQGQMNGSIQNRTGATRNGAGTMQNGFRGGMVSGEVTAKDEKSLTIKMADGSSKIVVLSGTTTYSLASESSLDKISVGTKVAAFGTANSDGSTTATSIETNPILRGQTTATQ
jgi:hypothetical protein